MWESCVGKSIHYYMVTSTEFGIVTGQLTLSLDMLSRNIDNVCDTRTAETSPPSRGNFYARKIGSRVGRNQTTVVRICDRWMQEGTTDRRDQSHPPQCNTLRENRQIVRIAVTDRSVTSRTVAQHIESVTHHSVSAHTIRLRLQQSDLSAIRPLLGLPLT
ncbi:transposable element Tcb1 transposase [Trichonephila clavipes]|nr:transposable element Tcb1 transposase [Trichonephila clavipes]